MQGWFNTRNSFGPQQSIPGNTSQSAIPKSLIPQLLQLNEHRRNWLGLLIFFLKISRVRTKIIEKSFISNYKFSHKGRGRFGFQAFIEQLQFAQSNKHCVTLDKSREEAMTSYSAI